MWFYQHLAGGSGARPGTLVEARRKGNRPALDEMKGEEEEEEDDVWTPSAEESLVTYGSCELVLFPHNQWLLTVDFRRRKGGGGGGKSRRFILPGLLVSF